MYTRSNIDLKTIKTAGTVRVGVSFHHLLVAVGATLASYLSGYFYGSLLSPASLTNETGARPPTELDWQNHESFPRPHLDKTKKPPKSVYTGEFFDNDLEPMANNNSGWSQNHIDKYLDIEPKVEVYPNVAAMESGDEEDDDEEEEDDDDNYEDHDGPFQPAGQHLLIDIQNVDPEFLLDTERIAKAMIQVVTQSKLTLLSYHCHDLINPLGVSCAGVLLESHITLHTFPLAEVLVLDLFTCGSESLLPLVPILKHLFGVTAATGKEPYMHWSHKKRGYKDYFDKEGNLVPVVSAFKNLDSIDSQRYLLGKPVYLHKKPLVEESTEFQTVEIHEFAQYFASNMKEETTNKKVFLDGVLQSTMHGLEAYHEALVHPAMLSHPEPKRVAIIGGGEGATLREVLKHNTVEKCVMIEIDSEFVDLARESLSEWNDCSDLEVPGAFAASCFDDPRAELYLEDAIQWFIDRFGTETGDIAEEDKFDVIIMDALDPSSTVDFSDKLYGDSEFISALTRSLSAEGVLVVQTGEADDASDSPDLPELDNVQLHLRFVDLMRANGAVRIKSYTEGHGQFMAPWDFDIVFMGWDSQEYFHADPAIVDWKLSNQAISTRSGTSPFHYFDGAMMSTYQFPSRLLETKFCRDEAVLSKLCGRHRGFDPAVPNVPVAALEMKQSSIENAGRGVFFKESFHKGSYVATDEMVHSMEVLPFTAELIQLMAEKCAYTEPFEVLMAYASGYGYENEFYGGMSIHVDPGITTFINHGCNSTNNIGTDLGEDESAEVLATSDDDPVEHAFYDPFADRNSFTYLSSETLLKDVDAGQEVLDNYLGHAAEDNTWKESILELEKQCKGQDIGLVTAYERRQMDTK